MAHLYVALFRETAEGLVGLGTSSDSLVVEAVRTALLLEAEADVERFRPRSPDDGTPKLRVVRAGDEGESDAEA